MWNEKAIDVCVLYNTFNFYDERKLFTVSNSYTIQYVSVALENLCKVKIKRKAWSINISFPHVVINEFVKVG